MQKLFHLVLFALMASFYGHPKAEVVTGLGAFKIGMAWSELESWASTNDYSFKELSESVMYSIDPTKPFNQSLIMDGTKGTGENTIYIGMPGHEPSMSHNYHYRNNIPVNYLQSYKVVSIENYRPSYIVIDPLTLLFKNDQLVFITARLTDSIRDGLSAKYGEPKIKTKVTEKKCVFKLTGATKYDLIEKKTDYKWPSKPPIIAEGWQSNHHFDDCTSKTLGEIYIGVKGENETFRRLTVAAMKKHERVLADKKRLMLKNSARDL